ncbi:hypothetical protein DFH11DRAFT_1132177 [Phellopilus nigrolimitatus]|nr:hypothetical protein DFH11DRAFT_1132177 [Phellopilus nigrolimitatus]
MSIAARSCLSIKRTFELEIVLILRGFFSFNSRYSSVICLFIMLLSLAASDSFPSNLSGDTQDANLVRYAILATFTLQVYDYIITFGDEVQYVWRWRKAPCRQLPFLLNRYLPFITVTSATYFLLFNPDQNLCRPAHFFVAGIALLGAIIAECTLFLRVYAAYDRSRTMLILLLTLTIISILGSFVNTALYINKSTTLDIGLYRVGCLYVYRLKIEWISLVVLIVCESSAFLLFIARGISYLRHSNSTTMSLLCKDSLFCFVCIIGYSVVNLLFQFFASDLLCDALLIPQSVLHQTLCAHSFLRIRRSHEANFVSVDGLAVGAHHKAYRSHY